jgi:hypothetical protein
VALYQGDNIGNGTYLGVGTNNGAYFSLCFSDLSMSGVGSTTALTTETWTHIAGTWFKDTGPEPDIDYFRVYINGVEAGVSTAETVLLMNVAASGDPNAIGAMAGNNYFNGKIADIRVYVRALSANEIAALAQQ